MNQADIIMVGAGPGGYVVAIRAAQMGFSVLCIDKRKTGGGTCLNEGCIPSKAFCVPQFFERVRLHGETHGVVTRNVELQLGKMMARKDKVVQDLIKKTKSPALWEQPKF